MPEQNLNPDALKAAVAALHGDNCPDDPEPGEFCDCDAKSLERMCEVAVSAYLSALPAQPEVNSVEELDKLPVGTIIEDSEPCVLRLSPDSELWFVPGSTQGWVSDVIELPATVLYRPVEG